MMFFASQPAAFDVKPLNAANYRIDWNRRRMFSPMLSEVEEVRSKCKHRANAVQGRIILFVCVGL